jgi:hypothetical protein
MDLNAFKADVIVVQFIKLVSVVLNMKKSKKKKLSQTCAVESLKSFITDLSFSLFFHSRKKVTMHSLSLALIALMAVITLPTLTYANTTEGTELEEPKTLPLTDALKSDDEKQMKNVNEIWQEDVHEVVIRKQRGAKENGSGTTTGKKKERKEKNSNITTKAPKLNKNLENTHLETNNNTTHETIIGKKHQHHQSKHEKTNSKKHTSTIKPKPKDESNYQSSRNFLMNTQTSERK